MVLRRLRWIQTKIRAYRKYLKDTRTILRRISQNVGAQFKQAGPNFAPKKPLNFCMKHLSDVETSSLHKVHRIGKKFQLDLIKFWIFTVSPIVLAKSVRIRSHPTAYLLIQQWDHSIFSFFRRPQNQNISESMIFPHLYIYLSRNTTLVHVIQNIHWSD